MTLRIPRPIARLALGLAAIGSIASPLPAAPPANSPAAENGLEHGIIYAKPGTYVCFPSLVDLGDGRIAAEFGTRIIPSHVDFRGGTKRMVTGDGGRTWTDFPGPIISPEWKTADGNLVVADADGWIHVPESRFDELQAQEKYVHKNAGPGQVTYLGGAHYKVSADNGHTWTKHPIPVPETISGLMHYHDGTSRLRTAAGVRLTAVYGPDKGAPRNADKVYFLRSADDGKTWSVVPMLPQGVPDPKMGFNETALAELPGGGVLAMMRSNPEGYLYQSVSEDQGLTWSPPEKTAIWGFPCDLLVLPDKRLLCVYGYRRSPMGVRACVSADGGRTWDVKNEIILRDDGRGGGSDIGYPRVVALPDGKLLTAYYIATDGTNRNVHAAWTRFDIPPVPAAAPPAVGISE
jgi:sialidase-1